MNLETANSRLFTRLAIIALGMFGFGFALVPFYNQICAALGVNSLTQPDSASNTQIDVSRTVSIELDSNIHDLPWRFRPLVNHLQVHPGELNTVEYEIVNRGGGPVHGRAGTHAGPRVPGGYSKSHEACSFTQQTLTDGSTS